EVGVAIFMKPGESITEDALKAHCASRLAKFKIPRYVWFYDQPFPRNASGKFLKREVRDQLVETLQG
ncbi:MAG: AMP-dependent synthetase, partial [Pseudomonadota bacterium]